MASRQISPPNPDEGFPIGRTVDGINVHECAEHHGYAKQFGKIRKQHTDFHNSETGERTEPPEYYRPGDYGGY